MLTKVVVREQRYFGEYSHPAELWQVGESSREITLIQQKVHCDKTKIAESL